MKKITKIIPILGLVLALVACEPKPSSNEGEQDNPVVEPGETAEQKALREAKESAQALLDSANEANYIGDELEQLRTLKANLSSAIESAKTPADLTEASQALSNFLQTAKTKAAYEAEAAAALAAAKQAAQEYLQTVDVSLYRGEEKSHLEGLITTLNGLVQNGTSVDEVNNAVQAIKDYLKTAKTKAQYEAEELEAAKQAAQEYLQSVDSSLYEGEELAHIQDAISTINGLLTSATQASQISEAVQALKDYLRTAKTAAEYEAEAAAALAKRKEERAKEIPEVANIYRSEEYNALNAARTAFINEVNAATSIEAVNAVSKQAYLDLEAKSKTDAEYLTNEIVNYPDLSPWALVNEHAANYVVNGNKLSTSGLGFEDVGYRLSLTKYSGNFEVSLRASVEGKDLSTLGLFFGNYATEGDGITGYLINFDFASDHQFVQIWFAKNAYNTTGASVLQYIGGWVYNDNYTTLLNDDFIRVKFDGTNLHIMNDADYKQFGEENTIKITVPLAYNGEMAVSGSYQFGMLNWDGRNLDKVRSLEIGELSAQNRIDSNAAAVRIAQYEVAKVDLTLYEDAEKAQFETAIGALETLYEDGTYAQIIAKVEELRVLEVSLKTHEQLEIERHPNIATQVLDNIYSGDPTKYTPSNWDLVDEHGLGWAHVAGSNTVVTDGQAGYCMDAAVHTNYTVVFKVTGTQASNPYNASWPDSAIIIGGKVDNTTGNYFKGYYICLSQSWGFQIYDAMAGANQDLGCYGDQFRGGFDCNAEGVTFRINIINGALTVYVIDPNTGVETRMVGVDGGFADTDTWNIGEGGTGHFGFLDWGTTPTTYQILEFKDL